MSPFDSQNGWSEWGKHVLKTLEDNSEKIDAMIKAIGGLEVEVGKLQVKAGIWGAVAGLITATLAQFILNKIV